MFTMRCIFKRNIYFVRLFFSQQVKVTILDKNDNRPTWPSAPIEYKISEEIPVGSSVATLRAVDPDLDSTLTYSIIGDDDNSSPLALDAHTGIVRVRRPIDRETSPRHVLPVRVSDGVHDSDTSIVFIVSIPRIVIDVDIRHLSNPLRSSSSHASGIGRNTIKSFLKTFYSRQI